jgi:hypothetical protein
MILYFSLIRVELLELLKLKFKKYSLKMLYLIKILKKSNKF